MTTKRRSPAKKAPAKKAAAKKAPAKRASSTRKRSTTSSTRRTPRKKPATATTLGAAVGTVVVAFLLDAPWSVRIALIVVLLVAAVGYLVVSRRS